MWMGKNDSKGHDAMSQREWHGAVYYMTPLGRPIDDLFPISPNMALVGSAASIYWYAYAHTAPYISIADMKRHGANEQRIQRMKMEKRRKMMMIKCIYTLSEMLPMYRFGVATCLLSCK